MMNVTIINSFEELTQEIASLKRRAALVADEALRESAERLAALLESPLLLVPSGEVCKTRQEKERIEDFLLEKSFLPGSVLVALGGGSVGDLVGFTASTYCRGIPFVNIPTTLLAMVDACIGGKTAINTSFGKNTLGSFWPSAKTLIYPPFLETLPPLEVACGAMEMIKHGIIADEAYFQELSEKPFTDLGLIQKSLQIKQAICEKDKEEKAERLLLNFGHTIGHAIETFFSYAIPHGMAVGLGLKAESYISYRRGFLKRADLQRIIDLVDKTALWDTPKLEIEALIPLMRRDKKALQGQIRISHLEAIGKPKEFCIPCEEKLLLESLEWLR